MIGVSPNQQEAVMNIVHRNTHTKADIKVRKPYDTSLCDVIIEFGGYTLYMSWDEVEALEIDLLAVRYEESE
jgi:hypothetical protein